MPTPRANDLDGHAETAVDPVGTSDATPEAQLITDGIKAQDCYQSRREELWRRLDREWGDKLSTLEFLKHQLLALEQAILILEDGGVFMRSEDKEGNDSVKGESTKKSAASVSDTSFDRPTPRIAGTFPTCKINPMSWDDYESTRGKANHAQSYAIDLQYEEQLQHSDEKSFSSASGPKVQAIPGSAKIESAAVRRPLPAKIRINSLPAMTAMDLLEDLILTGGYVESAVIPRPYYSLVYLEPKIRQHLCELRRTAVHLEETTGKDDELVLPLDFGSSFRDRVVLSGPDLSLLTLAECKELLNGLQCVVDFIDGYIVPLQKEMADDPRTVRPSELCFLFPSGTFVYVKDKKIPQKVWRVVLAFGAHQIECQRRPGEPGSVEEHPHSILFGLLLSRLGWKPIHQGVQEVSVSQVYGTAGAASSILPSDHSAQLRGPRWTYRARKPEETGGKIHPMHQAVPSVLLWSKSGYYANRECLMERRRRCILPSGC